MKSTAGAEYLLRGRTGGYGHNKGVDNGCQRLVYGNQDEILERGMGGVVLIKI